MIPTAALLLWTVSMQAQLSHDAPDRTISVSGGYSVAYSPDGALVAAAGDDKMIRIWDADTGALRLAMGGHAARIWAVAFSPDGKSIASASLDGAVRIANLGSGKFERELTAMPVADAAGMAFQPGAAPILAVAVRDRVTFWNYLTGQPLRTLERGGVKIGPLAFRPDGKVLVSGGGDGSLRLWDMSTGAFIRNADLGSPVMSVAASAAHVAGGCENGKVTLLDSDGGETELSGKGAAVYSVAFSADGARVAAGGRDHTIRIWDVKSGKLLLTLQGHTREVRSVAFRSNGRSIVSTGADDTVRFWQYAVGKK